MSSSAPKARFTKSISSMAGRTARYAVTLWTVLLAVLSLVAVVIAALLRRSAPRLALKAGRGRSCRSRAMRSSSASSGSEGDWGVREAAIIASSASASRSIRASSLMGVPHAGPQAFEGAKLKLLHGAFGSLQAAGDLANALLLDEALQYDALLIRWQSVHQVGEHGQA